MSAEGNQATRDMVQLIKSHIDYLLPQPGTAAELSAFDQAETLLTEISEDAPRAMFALAGITMMLVAVADAGQVQAYLRALEEADDAS